MGRLGTALLAGVALAISGGAVLAHHSFAMFDQEHPMELKGTDGSSTVWNLEGGSPSALVRNGWTSKTLKPGDELTMTIDPLRSGAPGGAWNENKAKFTTGQPIVTH